MESHISKRLRVGTKKCVINKESQIGRDGTVYLFISRTKFWVSHVQNGLGLTESLIIVIVPCFFIYNLQNNKFTECEIQGALKPFDRFFFSLEQFSISFYRILIGKGFFNKKNLILLSRLSWSIYTKSLAFDFVYSH